MSRYIHLNPVFTRAWKQKPVAARVAQLRQYRWSSYPAYLGQAKAPSWLETGPLPALVWRFGEKGRKRYGKFVERCLAREGVDEDLWSGNGLAIGDADFVEVICRRYEQACRRHKRENVILCSSIRRYQAADVIWAKCESAGSRPGRGGDEAQH